jgi:hypothetical protein
VGATCDDMDECTINDMCRLMGTCRGMPIICLQ